MGYSFDIQDDIIDTFASRDQYGRPPGGDLLLGKKPLHIVYTLKLADREEVNTLTKLTAEKQISPENLELVRQIISESGGLDAAKKKSKEHAEKAKELIAKTSLSSETKRFFVSLITYIEESLDWYK
jgi:geranylgeranyl pyrophosphate synthase